MTKKLAVKHKTSRLSTTAWKMRRWLPWKKYKIDRADERL